MPTTHEAAAMLSAEVRADIEMGGRRTAAFACECLDRNGYGRADRAYREIGLNMISDRSKRIGLSGEARRVWLDSATAHFEELAAGRAHEGGVQ